MSGEAEIAAGGAVAPSERTEQPAGTADVPVPGLAAMFAAAKRLDGTWPLFMRGLDADADASGLRGRYRMAAVAAARRSVRRTAIEGYLAIAGVLAGLAGGFAVLIRVFSTGWAGLLWALLAIAVSIPFGLWVERGRGGARFMGDFTNWLFNIVFFAFFPVAIYIEYADGPQWVVGLTDAWWMHAVQSIGTFSVTMVVAFLPVMAFSRLENRAQRASPAEGLFEHLANVLTHLEPDRRGQLTPQARQQILTALGKIASALRGGMPTVALGGTQLTRAVVRARAVEASHAVIDLQLWIALPSSTGLEDFRARICDLIDTILTGKYDRLPVRETTPETVRRAWHARIIDGTRTLVIAALPLAALFIATRAGLTLPAPYDAGASIAVWAWAVILVLGWLDPNFSTHLSAARDLTSITSLSRGSSNQV